ncbi:MAG: mechanosensitive ion channel family protein [Gammaproteobacteria bacterium]|nr:mechanosensitive ion channel family protein [Gammaproteobacteria bacterium]
MKKHVVSLCLPLLVLAVILTPVKIFAKDCPEDIKAVTADDAGVPEAVLTHRVKPLTLCELEAEAQAWLLLLQDKVAEISNAKVAAYYKKEEIKKTEKAEKALKEVQEAREKADNEDAKEASEEAKAALEEAQETEKKSVQDSAVQEAIKAAETRAKKEGEPVVAKDETEAKAGLKTALIKHVTDLTAERTALIDRFNVVLAEYTAKGGDAKEYDTYIKAVSGIKVDVTDASATWTTITGWLMSPEGGFRWAVNLIQFVVIVVVFYLLSMLAGKATQRAFAKSRHLSKLLRDFIVMSARRLVLIIGFFVALSALEVNIGPVLAIVGAAGFVIAFALQNSLSNFASGILMLIYRPFDMGETINVAGVLGKVESMNLLSTQLRTPDNKQIIVPNNSVWGDVITNVTGITERRVDLVFGIGYSDDIDKAQKILEEIVNAHERVMKEPEPVVRLHELADSSVNFICRPWVKPEDYWNVYWDITREVKRRFDAEGVSIPFPQRDVHVYQETA